MIAHTTPETLTRAANMLRLTLVLSLWSSAVAFIPVRPLLSPLTLASKKDAEDAPAPSALPSGTIVEFAEKSRSHIGQIKSVERKSNGAARYDIVEYPSGHHYSVADKEVTFTVPAPNSEKLIAKLLEGLEKAHALTDEDLLADLGIDGELLQMAWFETSEDPEHGEIHPADLVELVHSHSASPIEKYEAWRLLRSELGHVFFKELKENGRVVSFKAKAAAAVETSKGQFCAQHDEEELCEPELYP